MGNIIDYIIEYGDASFAEHPFCASDALALAQFFYIKLESAVPGPDKEGEAVLLKSLPERKSDRELFADVRFEENNRKVLAAMCKSSRFGNIGLKYYVNQIDKEKHSQFAAVTCLLAEKAGKTEKEQETLGAAEQAFVLFRGTDETITGWREDFDMACRIPVESQLLSVKYINQVGSILMKENPKLQLLLGGHSKGGNLAVYAAMFCDGRVQDGISKIYNLDGPGFMGGSEITRRYEKIASRVDKLIPRAAFVGMLFSGGGKYRVVESEARGMHQHNPCSWVIEKGNVLEAEEIYHRWKVTGEILNRFLETLTPEQLMGFVDEIFALLEACETETVMELRRNRKKVVKSMVEAFHDTDKETKAALWESGRLLLHAMREIAEEHIKERELKIRKLKQER